MRDVVVFARDPELGERIHTALEAASPGAEIRNADSLEGVKALAGVRAPSLLVVAGPEAAASALDVMAVGAARSRSARLVVLGGRANDRYDGGVRIIASDTDDADVVDVCTRTGGSDAPTLGDLTLASALRVANATSWSGALGLRTSGSAGALVIRLGHVSEASFGDLRGDAAVVEALASESGTLCLLDPQDAVGGAVESDLEALVARADEAREAAPDPSLPRSQESDASAVASEPSGEGFSLFSDEELAELALDDSMAIPLVNQRDPGSRKR